MSKKVNVSRIQTRPVLVVLLLLILGVGWTARYLKAQSGESSFEEQVKPFLKQNCQRCHNADTAISGVRVDQLNGDLEDRHLRLWEHIRRRVSDGSMPPKGQPQPSAEDR